MESVLFTGKLLSLLVFTGTALFPDVSRAQEVEVDIGIFYYHEVPEAHISVNTGNYELWGDNAKIADIPHDATISVKVNRTTLQVNGLGTILGYYHRVYVKQTDARSSLKVKALTKPSITRVYDHEIIVTLNKQALRLVNRVELNHYVAGTVEKEIGPSANLEYYKIQAIMCRTYALGNLKRHAKQGFQLCDEIHCQAYSGQSTKNRKIIVATGMTNDMIIADANDQLILAAYHSNCGGETIGAERVWTSSRSYLQPVVDTFCHGMNSAHWEKWISRKEWEKYLKKASKTELLSDAPICYYQDKREKDYSANGVSIPIRRIRKDWRFKSAFFSMEEHADGKILISGRGFGHGVGICQEGALRMTQLGYKYKEVINFYLKDVKLLTYSSLETESEAME